VTYRIIIAPTALKMLQAIKDRKIRTQLRDRINALAETPNQQGKALIRELAGHRSLRAAGQRYRIIYRVVDDLVQVNIVAAGIRKEGDKRDIYELTKKLIRLGLLDE
jgi:mRNA interferase RelE/StbE